MSSEERDIILQMLSEGKISPGEAGDLLDALDVKEESQRESSGWSWRGGASGDSAGSAPNSAIRDRGLLIQVTDGDDEEESSSRVNVHIPLGMALASGKFIPRKAHEYLERYGISLEELLESVSKDIARRGEIINVTEGDTRVKVAIT